MAHSVVELRRRADEVVGGQARFGTGITLPPRLIERTPAINEPESRRRTKLWEFSTNLHCSIVGTCLSTAELRQVLGKLGTVTPGATEHDLHHTAVALAARRDQPARLLHKALDHRHKLAINRFGKVNDPAALAGLWRDAIKTGDIPGAYWALLTHPATTPDLVRQAFGEVHMLSHLVGAANRADIRRLSTLEAENAQLRQKLEEQQSALHRAVTSRDGRIEALQRALADRTGSALPEPLSGEVETLRQLIGALQARCDRETRSREAAQARAELSRRSLEAALGKLAAACKQLRALEAELAVLEPRQEAPQEPLPCLTGLSVMYVGGRPHQVSALRKLAEQLGAAAFTHHDGGVEDALALLPALASRADLVVFPVDCVSHPAVIAVKKLCRQTGKRFLPLRTAGTASFLAALRRFDRSDADHDV